MKKSRILARVRGRRRASRRGFPHRSRPTDRLRAREPAAHDRLAAPFVPSTVRVRAVGNTLQVTQQPQRVLRARHRRASPTCAWARSLPASTRVEVYAIARPRPRPAVETLRFKVRERAEIAVFPPPTRPLTDYSGLWWNPQESGWGLSLHQTADRRRVRRALRLRPSRRSRVVHAPGRAVGDLDPLERPGLSHDRALLRRAGLRSRHGAIQAVGDATLDFDRPGRRGRAGCRVLHLQRERQ